MTTHYRNLVEIKAGTATDDTWGTRIPFKKFPEIQETEEFKLFKCRWRDRRSAQRIDLPLAPASRERHIPACQSACREVPLPGHPHQQPCRDSNIQGGMIQAYHMPAFDSPKYIFDSVCPAGRGQPDCGLPRRAPGCSQALSHQQLWNTASSLPRSSGGATRPFLTSSGWRACSASSRRTPCGRSLEPP
jgi:hypothetical protein